jgi:uncharacterized protein (DUF983 family)
MINTKPNRILLHACPRCRGDLFPEIDDKDTFACLQCGRRIGAAQLTPAADERPVLVSAA